MRELVNWCDDNWQMLATVMISGLLALGWSRIRAPLPRWVLLVAGPFALAYLVYWSLVWLSTRSESVRPEYVHVYRPLDRYRGWDLVFVGTSGLPALVCSILVGLLARIAAGGRRPRT